MRAYYAFLVVALALLLSACGGPNWQEFSSDEGLFTVEMPGTPEKRSQNIETAVGAIALNMFILDRRSSAYMVSYSDYPSEMVNLAGADIVLDGAVEGAVGNVNGTVTNQKNIELNGHPGREVELQIPKSTDMDEGSAKARIYLVDSRLYQVLVLGTSGSVSNDDMSRFLDSFKLKQ